MGSRQDCAAGWMPSTRAAPQFASAGLANFEEDAKTFEAWASQSHVASAIVAGLNDWSQFTGDPRRRRWLLDVARWADHDPTGWRGRVRESAVGDRAGITALCLEVAAALQSAAVTP